MRGSVGEALIVCGALLVGPARADCPPLGHMPAYVPSSSQLRAYDEIDFQVAKDGASEPVAKAGRTCRVYYDPKPGAAVASDLEIQTNYRQQITGQGGEILFADDRNTTGRLSKDGREIWMSVYSQETSIEVTTVEIAPHRQVLTAPSGRDYRLLGHMPGYEAAEPEKRAFDHRGFTVADGGDTHEVDIQGARYSVIYTPKGTDVASDRDIQENYREAIRGLGGQVMFADGRNTVARLEDKGQIVWVAVYSQESEIDVAAIEEKPFQASITPPTASALKTALDKDGRVPIYVSFDFDKASLKPDAKPLLAQVADLLKSDPSLRLTVEGHTDDLGGHDYNVKLSQARAEAVVAALSQAGIGADRLSPVGVGPDRPLTANDSEEGRAKNRRVELVRM